MVAAEMLGGGRNDPSWATNFSRQAVMTGPDDELLASGRSDSVVPDELIARMPSDGGVPDELAAALNDGVADEAWPAGVMTGGRRGISRRQAQ